MFYSHVHKSQADFEILKFGRLLTMRLNGFRKTLLTLC